MLAHLCYEHLSLIPVDYIIYEYTVSLQVPSRAAAAALKTRGCVRGHLALRQGDGRPLHPLLKSYEYAHSIRELTFFNIKRLY